CCFDGPVRQLKRCVWVPCLAGQQIPEIFVVIVVERDERALDGGHRRFPSEKRQILARWRCVARHVRANSLWRISRRPAAALPARRSGSSALSFAWNKRNARLQIAAVMRCLAETQ